MNNIDILEELVVDARKEITIEERQAILNLISENKELKEENERLKHSITKATEIIDEYANEIEDDTKKLIEYQEKYLNN